ncbi:MAG: hypothetical protein RBU37_17985, partial [Myxococcota bacterium]|nr:hypothetical protein [Myxococcota bacterium]
MKRELGEAGQAPNLQELRDTGQAPNLQDLRDTGQAPNLQDLRDTGQAPNLQEGPCNERRFGPMRLRRHFGRFKQGSLTRQVPCSCGHELFCS